MLNILKKYVENHKSSFGLYVDNPRTDEKPDNPRILENETIEGITTEKVDETIKADIDAFLESHNLLDGTDISTNIDNKIKELSNSKIEEDKIIVTQLREVKSFLIRRATEIKVLTQKLEEVQGSLKMHKEVEEEKKKLEEFVKQKNEQKEMFPQTFKFSEALYPKNTQETQANTESNLVEDKQATVPENQTTLENIQTPAKVINDAEGGKTVAEGDKSLIVNSEATEKYAIDFLGLLNWLGINKKTNRSNLEAKLSPQSKNELYKLWNDPEVLEKVHQMNFDNLKKEANRGNVYLVNYLNKELKLNFKESEADKIAVVFADNTRTWENIKDKELKEGDVIKLIADMDRNGEISGVRNGQGEEQVGRELLSKLLTKNSLRNFLNNIAYKGGYEGLVSDLKNNPFGTLLSLERLIQTALSRPGVELSTLTASPDRFNKIYNSERNPNLKETSEMEKDLAEAFKMIDNDPKIKNASGEVKRTLKEELIHAAKNANISVVGGDAKGAGVSFDVKSATRNLIDNVGAFLVNGQAVLGVNKELYNTKYFNFGVAGGISPGGLLIGGNGSIKINEKWSIDGTVSTLGFSGGATYRKLEGTSHGVDVALEPFTSKKALLKKYLLEGRGYSKELEPLDQKAYEGYLKIFGGNSAIINREFDHTFDGMIGRMRINALQDIEGFNFSSFSAGVGKFLGFIYPYLGATFERIKVEHKEVFRNVELQKLVTNINIDYNIVDYKEGFKVVEIPGINKGTRLNYFAPSGFRVEADFNEATGKLYIGGNIKDIKIGRVNFTDIGENKGEELNIYFNGATDKNKAVAGPIVNPIPQATETVTKGVEKQNNISVENQEELRALSNIISGIEKNINRSHVNLTLQNDLKNVLQSGIINNDVWNSLKSFLAKRGLPFAQQLTDNQKMMIISRVYGRFMADKNVVAKEQTWEQYAKTFNINSKDTKSKNSYNYVRNLDLYNFEMKAYSDNQKGVSRAQAFSEQFRTFWKIDPAPINTARSNLLENHFKGMNSFGKTNVDDMVAFVVSAQINGKGDRVFTGVTPLMGTISVATGKDGTPAMETIRDEALKTKMVDHLPSNYKTKLLKSINDVTDENINNDDLIKILRGETVKNISLKYDTVMFKWGDCFNDAVGMKDIQLYYKKPGEKITTKVDIVITGDNVTPAVESEVNINKINIGFTEKFERKPPTNTPPTDEPPLTVPGEKITEQNPGDMTKKPGDNPGLRTSRPVFEDLGTQTSSIGPAVKTPDTLNQNLGGNIPSAVQNQTGSGLTQAVVNNNSGGGGIPLGGGNASHFKPIK